MWLETKYLNLLSFRLRNFKRKTNNTFNMSCPYCGDSKSDKRKARGYVYPKNNKLLYFCHNCGVTTTIPKLVEYLDQNLFGEYLKESLLNKRVSTPETDGFTQFKPPVFVNNTPLKSLKKISQLPPHHPVKKYIDNRQIPSKYHHKLFLCKNFMSWVNNFKPGQFEPSVVKNHDEPRLIIPFLDQHKKLFGLQGRSLKKNSDLRYITVMLNDNQPKLFGLDTANFNTTTHVVEGPLDSMFLSNAIASAGSDLTVNLEGLGPKSNFVIVYDNEPRNTQIVSKIKKAIENGYNVCIWPDQIIEKDINDMFLSGYDVESIINSNTFSGLIALTKLQMWKKV